MTTGFSVTEMTPVMERETAYMKEIPVQIAFAVTKLTIVAIA